MRSRAPDPRRLDVEAFAKEGAQLQGVWPLAELPRLQAMAAPESAPDTLDVRWAASGERAKPQSAQPRTLLHLSADAVLPMTCQRCLQPVAVPVALRHTLRFVAGEDEAARLDAEGDEDVLATTPRLDLRELLEDELLMALPLVPRHDDCRPPVDIAPLADEEPQERPHPFAALGGLRRPTS